MSSLSDNFVAFMIIIYHPRPCQPCISAKKCDKFLSKTLHKGAFLTVCAKKLSTLSTENTYETLLHDVSAPECSAIAACNEHLSGCRIGNPVTELVKELRNSEPAAYHYMRRIRNETA